MINTEVDTRCPFHQPRFAGLVWRTVTFTHDPLARIHWGEGPSALTIPLPADLAQAVPKRQAEFLAGRLCAALALQTLGVATHVPRNGRAPVWPNGTTGSITHTDTYAAAVASTTHNTLGLDCEIVMDTTRALDISGVIMGPAETAFRPDFLTAAQFVTLVFSAKEALYKGISNRVGRVLAFSEVQLLSLTSDNLKLSFDDEIYLVNWMIEGHRCFTLYGEPRVTLDDQTS